MSKRRAKKSYGSSALATRDRVWRRNKNWEMHLRSAVGVPEQSGLPSKGALFLFG